MARRPLGSDPLRSFRFQVTINLHTPKAINGSIAKLGFQSVSGLSFTNNMITYREGGDNSTSRKMPGTTDFGDVTLQHGVGAVPEVGGAAYTGQELFDWNRLIFSSIAGGGLNSGGVDFRAEVYIDILEFPITSGGSYTGMPRNSTVGPWPIKARWVITNAWPDSMSWGDFDATNNSIVIESLSLANEGITCIYASVGRPVNQYLLNDVTSYTGLGNNSYTGASNKAAAVTTDTLVGLQ